MKKYSTVFFTAISVLVSMMVLSVASANEQTMQASPSPKSTDIPAKILYTSDVLSISRTDSEVIVKNVSTFSIAIRVSWDGNDPHGKGDGEDSLLENNVAPDREIIQEFKEHTSVQVWAWNLSGNLVDSCTVSLISPSSSPTEGTSKIVYQGDTLIVSQTKSEIIVKNVSSSPVALRISWDGMDPYGKGEGEDSFLNNRVLPETTVARKIKEHNSVQIWAWNPSGELVDSYTLPITPPTPTPQDVSGEILYEGNVFSVTQTKSEIIVENTSTFWIAVRISWDRNDPGGIGKGKDSFLDDNVSPHERVKREFKEHMSVQIWAWDSSGKLVDSCDVQIRK